MTERIADLTLYNLNNIEKVMNLFKNYIIIDLKKIENQKIKLTFIGKESEIYCKEFFNYLIIFENRGI